VVTVPTVVPSAGAITRQRRLARARHTAAVLPLSGVTAGAGVAAVAVSVGELTWPVLGSVLAWPLALLTVAGRAPSAGTLGRHHRRGIARAVVVFALAQWVLGSWLGIDPMVLLAAVATLAGVTYLGTVLSERAQRAAGVRPRALVVGDLGDLRVVMSQVAVTAGREVDVVGGCTPEDLAVTVDRVRPDVIVAVPSARLSGRALQRLTWQIERGPDGHELPLLLLNGLQDVAVRRSRPLNLAGLGVVEVTAAPQTGVLAAAKIAWERVAAALALAFLAPVLLGLALAIRLDSRGPALFRQTRVGRNGRHFTMYKLRTMSTDAEAVRDQLDNDVDEVLFKSRQDPRITRIGRQLRRYSLDELPQLINVVRGDMSLVGPRPALPAEVATYDHDPLRRLAVRPGLTGLWQVSGRSDLSWRESVRLDLDYVDNWSLPRDLSIVGRTLQAVLGHRGAY
jgi:exopolysaccharide biosynthesis polyprenyl glycosylphosphotransferase